MPATRWVPRERGRCPRIHSHEFHRAWARRIQSGQALTQMARDISRLDPPRALQLFADWTDRIAAGELPFAQPQRPQGMERNVVLTLWDWSRNTTYLHDLIGTDRRNPGFFPRQVLRLTLKQHGLRACPRPRYEHGVRGAAPGARSENSEHLNDPMQPSASGAQPIWDSMTSNHNPMMDEQAAYGSPRACGRSRTGFLP